MWRATFWECSECGGRIERPRPPALCPECGTAGVIFVPLDDPNDEIDSLGWTTGCARRLGDMEGWTDGRAAGELRALRGAE